MSSLTTCHPLEESPLIHIVQSDYFGIVSGNDVPDKVAKAGFTITPSPNVDAPIINLFQPCIRLAHQQMATVVDYLDLCTLLEQHDNI